MKKWNYSKNLIGIFMIVCKYDELFNSNFAFLIIP